jgi:hypothetical protein
MLLPVEWHSVNAAQSHCCQWNGTALMLLRRAAVELHSFIVFGAMLGSR